MEKKEQKSNIEQPVVMLSLRANIEGLGYKIQHSSWDREDLSRMTTVYVPHPMFGTGIQFERVINDQDVWQIYLGEKTLEIVHAYKGNRSFGFLDLNKSDDGKQNNFKPIMDFERLFYGRVNNEEELIKVMEQVGCPFDRNGA